MAVDGTTLTLGFSNAGARESFAKGGSAEIVRQAAIDVVGADWKIETIVDPGAQVAAAPAPSDSDDPWAGAPGLRRSPPDEPAGRRRAPAARAGAPPSPAAARGRPGRRRGGPRGHPGDPPGRDRARRRPTTSRPPTPTPTATTPTPRPQGLAGAELLQRTLGAQVIEEIPHQ